MVMDVNQDDTCEAGPGPFSIKVAVCTSRAMIAGTCSYVEQERVCFKALEN